MPRSVRAIFFGCYGLSLLVQHYYQSIQPVEQHRHNPIPVSLALPSHLFCGFSRVYADWHWLLYSHNASHYANEVVYAYADAITNLDQHFNVVYRNAAMSLLLRHEWQHCEQLIAKSLCSPVQRDDWRCYLYSAYALVQMGRYKEAAVALRNAQALPAQFTEAVKQDRSAPPLFMASWQERLEEKALQLCAKQHEGHGANS